ncbi:putative spermidine/putrescine transport system permease protein [Sinorhizobium kostiense]|uniref:Spermidine/putrescine transport system permease protein n=1 Tax=Sinorhizobium kostiense TaxID=76747 RepID=A0ABS4QZQ6_9HYPH|nr:ABC transporter permease [Sinorhizobium kostiense]MBP2236118.1 putative spermidine/putrescine transport system permease protein [Sinorhizobium kostiense]
MSLPVYARPWERLWYYSLRAFCIIVLLFLVMPVLVIIPLSFNAEPYFTFTEGMLKLDPAAFSLRWYRDVLENGMVNQDLPVASWAWLSDVWQNSQWVHSAKNSFSIAIGATLLSTLLGTLAALGLSQEAMPARRFIIALLISPIIVPVIVTSASMFFLFAKLGLTNNYLGIVVAHTVFGAPFVVITVTAAMAGFDRSLIRAGQMLGAGPLVIFLKIIMPLILPGVISGALFAFGTSFDEVVAVIFLADYEQRTIPRQMWAGIREQISPAILAVASILVCFSILLLMVMEVLRRRAERIRGVTPA